MSNSRGKRALAALGVFSIFGGMGWMRAPGLAALTLTPAQSASISQDAADVTRALNASDSFKVGSKTIYTKTVKGVCDDGEVKLKMRFTQKVNWEWANGNVGKKVVKKGVTVCQYVAKAGVASEATYNAQGVMTALPKSFPINPTVAEIQNLGLTPHSKVSDNLRVPQPAAPITVAEQASTVTPVSAGRPYVVTEPDGYGQGGFYRTELMNTTWTITGGNGVLSYGEPDQASPRQTSVLLNPNGSLTVTVVSMVSGEDYLEFPGELRSDFGQTSLPDSMTQEWRYKNNEFSEAGANMRPSVEGTGDGIMLLNGKKEMVKTLKK